MKRLLPLSLLTLGLAAAASAQSLYPEGAPVPRHMTDLERVIYATNPPAVITSQPPLGPIACPGEYAPMEGLLLAWEGTSSWLDILAAIAREITSADGAGKAYIVVDDSGEISTARSRLQNAGVNMSRVEYVTIPTDTIWIRDYGPRYITIGGVRAIVDHTYNRPRPLDDRLPQSWGPQRREEVYNIPLRHGGGNFHLDSVGRSYVTRLINNENTNLTEQQIFDLWRQYQNVQTTFFDPFRTSIDSTQHIDMWMQVFADDGVVISDWVNAPGSFEDRICDNAATFMQSRGYRVVRTPAVSISGVHYTYTNVVIFNGVVLVPQYSSGSGVGQRNADALAAWAQAMPDKRIVGLNAQPIVTASGVFHCIVMHVPRNTGGANPVVYVTEPNGMGLYRPGERVTLRWITDDDAGVQNVDIQLSVDGGRTFSNLATQVSDSGSFVWTVPNRQIFRGQFRVVARDAVGNTGSDASDGTFRVDALQQLTPN